MDTSFSFAIGVPQAVSDSSDSSQDVTPSKSGSKVYQY